MRSKEVEEAINQLKEDVNIIIYGNKIFEDRTTCKKEDLKTVLAYIEELEAKLEFKQFGDLDSLQFENTYLDKQVIRDKIKELEEEYEDITNRKAGCFTLYREKEIELEFKIDILKSMIGE